MLSTSISEDQIPVKLIFFPMKCIPKGCICILLIKSSMGLTNSTGNEENSYCYPRIYCKRQ